MANGCKYIYRNGDEIKEFDSYDKALDFVVERKQQLQDIINNKRKDIVFDATSRDITQNKLSKIAADAKNYKVEHNKEVFTLQSDIDSSLVVTADCIGTTKFLSGLTDINGNLLFPEFREENYWATRKQDWAKGEYTKEELAAIGTEINGEYVITDPTLSYEEKRKLIEAKWEQQANLGIEIHKAMEIFFRYDRKDTNVTLFTIPDNNQVLKIIKNKYKFKHLSDDQILTLIENGRDIVNKFGGPTANVNFYPEFKISALTSFQNEKSGKSLRLVGVIDLLVLDASGNVHLVDYKTGLVPYMDFDSAKKLTFKYQMATYHRILSNLGLSTVDTKIYISPIKVNNLRQEGGVWKHESLSYQKLVELDVQTNTVMQNNIDRFLPEPPIIDSTPEKLSETINKALEIIAPNAKYNKIFSDEEIETLVDEHAELNAETNIWSAEIHNISLTGNSKEDLIRKFRDNFNSKPKRRNAITINIQNRIKEALEKIKTNDPTLESFEYDSAYGDTNWIYNYISKYLNSNWDIVDTNEIALYHGMIVLKNNITSQVDILMVQPSALRIPIKQKFGELITGNLQEDVIEKSKIDSLAFESNIGNIELMKAMVMLNQMPRIFSGGYLGNINVVNPTYGEAMTASNEQIHYNWKIINEIKPLVETNHLNDGKTIKRADAYTLARNMFEEILSEPNLTGSGWSSFDYETIQSKFDLADAQQLNKRTLLVQLKEELEQNFKYLKTNFDLNTDYNDHPEIQLYAQIQLAIAETSNIKMNQVCKDGRLWIDDMNILKKGLGGLLQDNPGNFKNQNLNMITKLVMQVYQNVRDTVTRFQPSLDKEVNALKEAKGFTALKERTFGNQTSLYANMVTRDGVGNIIVKNPWDFSDDNNLTADERKFLEFFLIEINKNRLPKSINQLETIKKDSTHRFFWLPLAQGDIKSHMAHKGLLRSFKDKLKGYLPKNIVNTVKDDLQGFVQDEEVRVGKAEYLFQMNTQFDLGEGSDRMRIINERTKDGVGMSYFELNLETLLLKHKFGYTTKEYMDEMFPDIQAISTNIKLQEFAANSDFEAMNQYVNDFIKSKILKKQIDDKRFDAPKAYSRLLMKHASYLALAFNPKQMYQFVEGIWQDVSLFIRRSDGSMKFTFSNLRDSFLNTLPELVNFKGSKSKWDQLNELYALNDMGIDEYVERIKSDKFGFWNFFNRTAFKFASRPDFYNRATIFGAQMRADGCWEAHVLDENGILHYDWSLDKRFNLVATGNKENLEAYNQQKALYIATAKQLMAEKARNEDGTLFVLSWDENGIPTRLPKAYTTLQSESHKDIADSIYGYYAEEKKSLMQAYGLGSLIMQMNTYWSAKKNQYLAPGNVKLQGKFEVVEGWYLDEEGNPTQDPSTGIPLIQWRGDFTEGIIVTAFSAGSVFFQTQGTMMDKWQAMIDQTWNHENEKLRRAYRNNLNQLWYDILMTFFMGKLIAGSLREGAKKYVSKSNDPFVNLTVDFGADIFFKSFTTFDFVSGVISNRGLNWTPFSLQTTKNLIDGVVEIMEGDKKIQTFLLNSSGLSRTLKPALKEIVY